MLLEKSRERKDTIRTSLVLSGFLNEHQAMLAHTIAKNKLELSTFSWMVKRENQRKAAEKKKKVTDAKRAEKKKATDVEANERWP